LEVFVSWKYVKSETFPYLLPVAFTVFVLLLLANTLTLSDTFLFALLNLLGVIWPQSSWSPLKSWSWSLKVHVKQKLALPFAVTAEVAHDWVNRDIQGALSNQGGGPR